MRSATLFPDGGEYFGIATASDGTISYEFDSVEETEEGLLEGATPMPPAARRSPPACRPADGKITLGERLGAGEFPSCSDQRENGVDITDQAEPVEVWSLPELDPDEVVAVKFAGGGTRLYASDEVEDPCTIPLARCYDAR